MTPVATLVAITATTWDAALEETLSIAARRPSATAAGGTLDAPSGTPCAGTVHSVHRRAANLLVGDLLIAVVSDELDDAPWTVRVAPADWTRLHLTEGDPVAIADGEIRIDSAPGIRLSPERRWTPAAFEAASIDAGLLVEAHGALSLFHDPAPQTPFGRASTALLSTGVERLRTAMADALTDAAPASGIFSAVGRLIGLGEGLTPSGDDVLTGFAFLAAQPGMLLNRVIPPLAAAVDAHAERTTLLSAVTIRSALAGRGRQSMHDVTRALPTPDSEAFRDAAGRILAIGHSSGADLLTGMRLALELEAQARTTQSAVNRKAIA